MISLPPIYPITDTALSGLDHLEQIRRLAAAGAGLVQIRDKSAATGDLFRIAREAVEFARTAGITLIVNDRVDIAIAAGADGVHLGQDDLPPADARRLLGDSALIGFSTHSIEQVIAAAEMPVDYIAFGPVFRTGTKEDPDPVVGLESVREAKRAAKDKPLVAIGGIASTNVADVIEAGADSAAVISDLFSSGAEIADSYSLLVARASQKPMR